VLAWARRPVALQGSLIGALSVGTVHDLGRPFLITGARGGAAWLAGVLQPAEPGRSAVSSSTGPPVGGALGCSCWGSRVWEQISWKASVRPAALRFWAAPV